MTHQPSHLAPYQVKEHGKRCTINLSNFRKPTVIRMYPPPPLWADGQYDKDTFIDLNHVIKVWARNASIYWMSWGFSGLRALRSCGNRGLVSWKSLRSSMVIVWCQGELFPHAHLVYLSWGMALNPCLFRSYEPNPSLSSWVATQRKYYKMKQDGKPNHLTDEREKQLDAMDFVWNYWDYNFRINEF